MFARNRNIFSLRLHKVESEIKKNPKPAKLFFDIRATIYDIETQIQPYVKLNLARFGNRLGLYSGDDS